MKGSDGKRARRRRHRGIRKRIYGTAQRPRLCVFRSLRFVYAQVIDDDAMRTLVQASSAEDALVPKGSPRRAVDAARAVGKAVGERAREAGIDKVVFDRGGCLYHGRVRAVAEGAREAGLQL